MSCPDTTPTFPCQPHPCIYAYACPYQLTNPKQTHIRSHRSSSPGGASRRCAGRRCSMSVSASSRARTAAGACSRWVRVYLGGRDVVWYVISFHFYLCLQASDPGPCIPTIKQNTNIAPPQHQWARQRRAAAAPGARGRPALPRRHRGSQHGRCVHGRDRSCWLVKWLTDMSYPSTIERQTRRSTTR